jgi:predicted SprT family Zn-dependent metalloprotease
MNRMACDCCGNRFDEDDLEYVEESNEYLCQDCMANLAVDTEEYE